MKRGPRLFCLRGTSQFPSLWIEEDERVFYTRFNEAEDDDGCFKFRNSQFLIQRKLATTLKQILCFFNLSISLLWWKEKIYSEINANIDLLVLLFWNGVQGKSQKGYGSMWKKGLWQLQIYIELGQVSGRFAPNPVRPLSRFAPIPVRPHLLIVL